MTRNPILISSLIAVLALFSCGKAGSSDSSAAFALLGGSAGSGGSKPAATAEAAPSAATSAAVTNAVSSGQTTALLEPIKRLQNILISHKGKPSAPTLFPTALTYKSGSCSGSGMVVCTAALLQGSSNCQGGGTMTINYDDLQPTTSGLYMNLTYSGYPTITTQATLELRDNASITYSNCTVTYTDPIAQAPVMVTLNGTVTALTSNQTSEVTIIASSPSGSSATYTTTATDSTTVSNLQVNGQPLNGTFTTATALNGSYSTVYSGTSVVLTMNYGPNSTFKVNGETKADLSNLSVQYQMTCSDGFCH